MKFSLLIAATAAIRLQQKQQSQAQDGPTPADIMAMCDKSGNGEIDKKEAHDCINA